MTVVLVAHGRYLGPRLEPPEWEAVLRGFVAYAFTLAAIRAAVEAEAA